ncbi:hypothetical protein BD324DRAFT_653159 [Kockovaella imperatae]|uniref:Uncharacterized protein n=1 Tax=Kockovaella imperatae TaxID=4999 RepID=A0A1Y1U8P8_9TREE|nr:hypothetical protein BD324DRAFT_653159 [Kockovaella imperatae]ORX34382.1 hypothetical protein BD324DRAFT_653159 [Kockovaella imperatae]
MSCSALTPPRRIIKITSDPPSTFVSRKDPRRTPTHPHLDLPISPWSRATAVAAVAAATASTTTTTVEAPSSTRVAAGADSLPHASSSSSSPRHRPMELPPNPESPLKTRRERSESIVCLSSPVKSSRLGSDSTSAHSMKGKGKHREEMDDSDEDRIPPLSEALDMGDIGGGGRKQSVLELQDTAKRWIGADTRMSERRKRDDTRQSRLAELQAKRRKVFLSPSPSASPGPMADELGSSVPQTSDSITQPTTPYDRVDFALGNEVADSGAELEWSPSPVGSPRDIKHGIPKPSGEGMEGMMSARRELVLQSPPPDISNASITESEEVAHPPSPKLDKGKGKGKEASLADLFQNDDGDTADRRRLDELNGHSQFEGQDDFDSAFMDVDPDSFTSSSGPSLSKAVTPDDDPSIPDGLEDENSILPLTQYDLSGVDLFDDDDDFGLLGMTGPSEVEPLSKTGGVVSPIVLIHELPEEYADFFREHWRRGADSSKAMQMDSPDRGNTKRRANASSSNARGKPWKSFGGRRKYFGKRRARGKA